MKKYLILSVTFLLMSFYSKAQVEITSTGTATAYALNVPGVFPLRNGVQVTFKAHTTCSASATMNVSATGALSIRKEGNTSPLTAGDIKTGQIVTLAYDGANWQMLSALGNSVTMPTTYWDPSGADIYNNNGGNVGIGITSPGVIPETGSPKYLSAASTNGYNAAPMSLELIGSNPSMVDPVTKMDFVHVSNGPTYDHIGSIQTFRGGDVKTGDLTFFTADAGTLAERMRIDNKGNVGIGTNTPAYNLQLFSTASTIMSIASGSTQKSRIYLGSTASPNLSAIEYDNSANSLNFWTNSTPNRIFIDNSGKVGVGTNAPGATFEVFQSTNPQIRLKTSAGAGVIFDYSNTSFSILNYDNTPIYFATGGGSTRMNIQSNGDVGIGTGIFTPSAKLHVIGGARITALVGPGTVIADASGNLSVAAGTTITGSGTNNYLARWTPSGSQLGIGATYDNGTNVGIGTPTPGKLAGANKYLTLAGTDLGTTNTTASLEIVGNTGSLNTMASKVDFLGLDLGNAGIPRARVEARSGNGQTLAGQLLFYTNSNGGAGNLIERMRIRESGEVGIGNVGVVSSLLSIGATNQFQVSNTGNIIRINDVPYSWPAANASGFLSNNGSGTLTWSTAGVLAGGTTNYVPKWSSANSLSSTSLIYDNGTSVGINTAAPSASSKLHVVGAGNGSTLLVDDNSITNGSVLYLSSTATTGTASNSSRMITIARSGANTNASHTAYGLQSVVTNTGTTNTNVAGYFSASGGVNDYAIIVPNGGGNVGIGTTTPTEPLTVSSNTGGAILQSIKSYAGTNFANSLALQKGRGTEAAPVAVNSADDLGYIDFYGYNSGNGSMQLGASIFATSAQAFTTANYAGSNLVFSTAALNSNAPVERMTVYYNGNVGIGTISTALFPLSVETSTALRAGYFVNNFNTASINMGVYGAAQGTGAGAKRGGSFEAYNGTGENVGVRGYALNSTATNYGVYGLSSGAGTTNYGVYGTASGATTNWAGYFMGNSYIQGRLGINETVPLYDLDVSSTSAAYAGRFKNEGTGGADGLRVEVITAAASTGVRYGTYSYVSNGLSNQYGVYGLAQTGGLTNYGVYGSASGGSTNNYGLYCAGSGGYTGTWSLISDQRFKENIKPLTGALDKILALEPKTYNLKAKEYDYLNFPTGTQIGLIAQDVEKVIPELVEKASHPGAIDEKTGEPTGAPIEFKSMNYIGLTPVLVQAIKEQQAQIEELKKQLEEQKKQLDKLEKK